MSKPLFTTKHYKAIARIMATSWHKVEKLKGEVSASQAFCFIQDEMFETFRKDNQKFKPDTFRKLVNKS